MPQSPLSIYRPAGCMPDAEATARIATHLHPLNEELRESGDSMPPWQTPHSGSAVKRGHRGRVEAAFVPEATALADWIALHQRQLTTIYITHGHADHFLGLPVLPVMTMAPTS